MSVTFLAGWHLGFSIFSFPAHLSLHYRYFTVVIFLGTTEVLTGPLSTSTFLSCSSGHSQYLLQTTFLKQKIGSKLKVIYSYEQVPSHTTRKKLSKALTPHLSSVRVCCCIKHPKGKQQLKEEGVYLLSIPGYSLSLGKSKQQLKASHSQPRTER